MATLHRFYVAATLAGGDVALPSEIAHQISTVLRLRPGDPVVLFDGSGAEWTAELVSAGRDRASARLLEHQRPQREPGLHVTLCHALLRADKFEWVLQKGTELGVAAFRPLVTRRTVAAGAAPAATGNRPAGEMGRQPAELRASGAKLARWRRIVVEAAEQSGRCVVPEIAAPCPLPAALDDAPSSVLLWEEERVSPFGAALAGAAAAGGGRVRLLVGPEGGFDPEEVQLALDAGAQTATLGPRVLRSETASLAALALALLPVAPPAPGALPHQPDHDRLSGGCATRTTPRTG